MIKVASSSEGKAMLAVEYKAGLRTKEPLSLNVGSTTFDDGTWRLLRK